MEKLMRSTPALLLLALSMIGNNSWCQNAVFTRLDSVQARENGLSIKFPAAGGFNLPQFSDIDLNFDGKKDLVVFDRAGNTLSTFINGGSNGQEDYTYAPEYEALFPSGMRNFALLADYDCDGLEDIFTSMNELGLKVYRNTSTNGNLSFSLAIDTVFTDLGAGDAILQVSPKDIPALVDVDGDTDLDILTFDGGGSFVMWHKNMSVENNSTCSFLDLEMVDACWGKFQESSLNQAVTLNISCRTSPNLGDPAAYLDSRHAGSTIAAFDTDNDGDLEILLGDLIFDGITYLHNGGNNNSAHMDSADVNWPAEDVPVRMNIFPASYILDVNNDGNEDVLVSPNADNISANYDNVAFYKDIESSPFYTPEFQTSRFLVDQMIDVGSASAPVFFDHNGDGLMDLVIGNYSFKLSANNNKAGLTLYENIGTTTAPEFELVTRNYAGLNGLFNPAVFGVAPTFGDLDNDGDQDLMIGEAEGRLHYFENVALTGQPADFALSQANFMGIDVGGYAFPSLVDWNRDGKLDLIVGEWTGKMKYYANTGTANLASFNSTPTNAFLGGVDVEPVCCTGNATPYVFLNPISGHYDILLGTEAGKIRYYPDAESASGNFVASTNNFGGQANGMRTTIHSADINADGQTDWVVGNLRGGVRFYTGDIFLGNAPHASVEIPALDIFPNPSKGSFQLRLDLPAKHVGQVEVLDLQGRKLLSGIHVRGGETVVVDGSSLADGMYLVECQVAGMAPVSKLWVLAR